MSQQLAQTVFQTKQKNITAATSRASILHRTVITSTTTPAHSGILQRCSNGVECAECPAKRLEREGLQRAAVNADPVNAVPPIVHDVLNSPGQSLDAGARAFMEPRFGHDFSGVRVHTDARAAESARSVNALAYTVGRNVVFGTGQYAPGTGEGRKLLAHELTHTIQQSQGRIAGRQMVSAVRISEPDDKYEQEAHSIADDVVNASPLATRRARTLHTSSMLQQQAAPAGAPAAQQGVQAAPQAASGWQGCSPDKTSSLFKALGDAVSWTNEAITDLQNTERPTHTRNALSRYLSTDANHITNIIIPKLKLMLAELNQGPLAFQCQTKAQCLKLNSRAPDAAALATHPISLCPPYFSSGSLERTAALIHECGHHADLGGDTYEWTWPFAGLSVNDRLGNADSFAAFVVSNHYPELAPYQQQYAPQVGVGALFAGSTASPRFLVTAEFDVLLAQRIFRFFDLHLGLRVDVDSSGTVIGSLTLGTRLFSPTSLSRVPFFLDLKGGAAEGLVGGTGSRDNLLVGPSGEARVGILTGNFGGSIGYRQIWNLLKDNSDIRELTINGEINF